MASFVVLIIGVIWSWILFNSKSSLSTQIHAEIQSKLAILIEDTLKSKKPNSSNFELRQMYTTAINENLISAQFSYKYSDLMNSENKNDSVDQIITGTALLAKTPSETSQQKWVVQSVKTSQESIDFNEGLAVTAGEASEANTAATDSATTANPETQTEKK